VRGSGTIALASAHTSCLRQIFKEQPGDPGRPEILAPNCCHSNSAKSETRKVEGAGGGIIEIRFLDTSPKTQLLVEHPDRVARLGSVDTFVASKLRVVELSVANRSTLDTTLARAYRFAPATSECLRSPMSLKTIVLTLMLPPRRVLGGRRSERTC
jgi:hypothetical protein